ncbi:3,4-dihydroxy-2-butanone-4-phosphate synthase [Pedobacter duraquae]|uniref:3,4-dihydroxy-2-butanone 4-phosphate synthase n=1 Tax=Pedobacter duraquae TaxID=425511 RepID=A0A4R6ICC7_9SPHI|nr:3,4-dihydroxy-2-butanone-4-phosphate synthase [Pedobacter duraquae]TDO19602.1 3,4-dihydroxy 2-butanone 4-phosphate synthase [Pedobacter duraquae]
MEHLLSRFGQTYKERIARAVSDINAGKGVLVVDNENRENEGDLIFSAEKMTVKDMALTIRECSGIVCLCITAEQAAQLNLPYMVADNNSKFQTPFTVTIEAKEGVTTGVSAADRIQTIKTAIANGAVPGDLARPGHVFPLIANADGVLGREGHTEGSVDLMKIAGLKPAAVLCELTNEDGTMAKLPELISFAEKHEIIVISIEDIICYRKNI